MPKYTKSRKGEMQRKKFKGFDSVAHMTQFLARCDKKTWHEYRKIAKDYLTGKKTPPRQLRKNVLRRILRNPPQRLVGHVEREHLKHRRNPKHSKLGGGLLEAVSTISHEAANLLGVPYLQDLLGKGPTRKPLTDKQQAFAAAIDDTYTSVGERKNKIGGMTRLPEYDSDRVSVWEQSNGEKFIAVHGTAGMADVKEDAKLLAGKENNVDPEVEAWMDRFDAAGEEYDIGGHSLATSFIYNALPEHGSHIDEIFLFNPASSPFQSKDYLKKHANVDERITFFVNEGDMVSSGLYQQMDQNTLDNRVHVGDYRWSPLAAHGLGQWYDSDKYDQEQEEYERQQGVLAESMARTTSAEDMAKIEEYGRRAAAYKQHVYTVPAAGRMEAGDQPVVREATTNPVDLRVTVI